MDIDKLEDLKINLLISSVIIMGALFLYAFADFYQCSIANLYRPLGYLIFNYFIPITLVYFGMFLGNKKSIIYYLLSLISLIWFVFYTVLNGDYSYMLPF